LCRNRFGAAEFPASLARRLRRAQGALSRMAPVRFSDAVAGTRIAVLPESGSVLVADATPGREGTAERQTQEPEMAKEELIEMEGVVAEVLPDTRYRVTLNNGVEVSAYAAGKMKKHRIRVLPGDRVTMELSPYDLTKGRIRFRHKD